MKILFDDAELIKTLCRIVPEARHSLYHESDVFAYLVFGNFGIFLRDRILEQPESGDENLLSRSFGLLNLLVEQGDERVIDMLRVTTFEVLTDYPQTIAVSIEYLKGTAHNLFLDVVTFIKG